MLNNYLSTDNNSNECPSYSTSSEQAELNYKNELELREKQQQRHYQLFSKLQKMARELPMNYQQRLPYDLLSSLANCLLDDSIHKIVEGLLQIQHLTEKSLHDKRTKFVNENRAKKLELQKRLMSETSLGITSYEKAKISEKTFDREFQDELNKMDMKIITELDQIVSDQQVTLERSGVPGFHVTNKPTEIQIQMYILQFVTNLKSNTR